MSTRFLFIIFAAAGIAPAVVWALLSLCATAFSVFVRPVSLSFRIHARSGERILFHFCELPVMTSLCILVGALLILIGIAAIPRTG